MYATTYHRPSSVDEAAALFAKGSEPKYLAGGHTLIPVMKQRLASPSDVIDLAKIKELVGIDVSADAVTVKAATTHYDVAGSGPVQKAIPALAYLASLIGDPAVRYRGTIGGSIANNDPAADYPAAVLALGATIKTNKRASRPMISSRACSRPRLKTARSSPRSRSRFRPRRDIENAPSRLALCADRRVRRARPSRATSVSPPLAHRKRRDAGAGDRGGAEGQLVAGALDSVQISADGC
jgi:hypothetical protein